MLVDQDLPPLSGCRRGREGTAQQRKPSLLLLFPIAKPQGLTVG